MKLAIFISLVVVITCQTQAPDHLLTVLQAIHKSHTFQTLPTAEKIILVELMSAAEVDQITHYIDRLGMARILAFLDHVNKIDQQEAHILELLLIKELNQESHSPPTDAATTATPIILGKRSDLQLILKSVQSNPAFKNLSQADQNLVTDLIKAAENGTVTPLIHQVGYARVIALIEHIGSPTETHLFLTYLVNHMNSENSHHQHPQPVGK